MSSVKKWCVDKSSLVFQSVIHVLLRDLTNYYWYKELQQQSQWFAETQNIQINDQTLGDFSFEIEGSNCNKSESINFNWNIKENRISEECSSHETNDKIINDDNFNTPRSTKEECIIRNLEDYVRKDDSGNNCSKDSFWDKNKTSQSSKNKDHRHLYGDLSELPDEQIGTPLKRNMSYIVISPKSDNDSLTYKILNNENDLGDNSFANRASTRKEILEDRNSIQDNLIQGEDINDITVCFKDVVSVGPPKTVISYSSGITEPTALDEAKTELTINHETSEINSCVIQDPPISKNYEKYKTSKSDSTESIMVAAGSVNPESQEKTFSTDSIWNVDIVQEKIQILLSALTSSVVEKCPEESKKLAIKLSDTSYDDSDNDSDIESYDELMKKVLSGTKSEEDTSQTKENCCWCTAEQSCLQVVEFDEAEELLPLGQMSSVDTGSNVCYIIDDKPTGFKEFRCQLICFSFPLLHTTLLEKNKLYDENLQIDCIGHEICILEKLLLIGNFNYKKATAQTFLITLIPLFISKCLF